MKTAIVLDSPPQHLALRASLSDLGYKVLAQIEEPSTLHDSVALHAPDVIIVATDTPSVHMLHSLGSIAESSPRPVVMFARDASTAMIRKAVGCGVGAYVVEGWARERLGAIIDAATARFEAYEAVRTELTNTRARLSERKLIEKAKGIVMEQRKLSEEHAYAALRKMAMDQNLALAEVARRIISVSKLLS